MSANSDEFFVVSLSIPDNNNNDVVDDVVVVTGTITVTLESLSGGDCDLFINPKQNGFYRKSRARSRYAVFFLFFFNNNNNNNDNNNNNNNNKESGPSP